METKRTLRDQFALAALAGLLACSETSGSVEAYARDAYRFADAMLTERTRTAARTDGNATEEADPT